MRILKMYIATIILLSSFAFSMTNILIDPKNNSLIDIGYSTPSDVQKKLVREWFLIDAELKDFNVKLNLAARVLSDRESCFIDSLGNENCPIKSNVCDTGYFYDPGNSTKVNKVRNVPAKLKEKAPTGWNKNNGTLRYGVKFKSNDIDLLAKTYKADGTYVQSLYLAYNHKPTDGGFLSRDYTSGGLEYIEIDSSRYIAQGARYVDFLIHSYSGQSLSSYGAECYIVDNEGQEQYFNLIGDGVWVTLMRFDLVTGKILDLDSHVELPTEDVFICEDDTYQLLENNTCQKSYSYYDYDCNELPYPTGYMYPGYFDWSGPHILSGGPDCEADCGPNGCECNSATGPWNNCALENKLCGVDSSKPCTKKINEDSSSRIDDNVINGKIYETGSSQRYNSKLTAPIKCKDDMTWNASINKCQKEVKVKCERADQIRDDKIGCYTRIYCELGEVYDGLLKKCITPLEEECPEGSFFDSTSNTCISELSCDYGGIYSDGKCIQILDNCPSGEYDGQICKYVINGEIFGDIKLTANAGAFQEGVSLNGNKEFHANIVRSEIKRSELVSRGYGSISRINMAITNIGSGRGGIRFYPAPDGFTKISESGGVYYNEASRSNYLIATDDGASATVVAFWNNPPEIIKYTCDDYCSLSKVTYVDSARLIKSDEYCPPNKGDVKWRFNPTTDKCEANVIFNPFVCEGTEWEEVNGQCIAKLRGWEAAQNSDTSGIWSISPNNMDMFQAKNAGVILHMNPKVYTNNLVFSGDFTIMDYQSHASSPTPPSWIINDRSINWSDDDFVGFVFGYKDGKSFLLSMNRSVLNGGGGHSLTPDGKRGSGISLRYGNPLAHGWGLRATGTLSMLQLNAGSRAELEANPSIFRGWNRWEKNKLKVTYNREKIIVAVNGVEVINYDMQPGQFKEGQVGFLNYSQGGVLYNGFELLDEGSCGTGLIYSQDLKACYVPINKEYTDGTYNSRTFLDLIKSTKESSVYETSVKCNGNGVFNGSTDKCEYGKTCDLNSATMDKFHCYSNFTGDCEANKVVESSDKFKFTMKGKVNIKAFGFIDYALGRDDAWIMNGYVLKYHRLLLSDGKWYNLNINELEYNVLEYSDKECLYGTVQQSNNCISELEVILPSGLRLVAISDQESIDNIYTADNYFQERFLINDEFGFGRIGVGRLNSIDISIKENVCAIGIDCPNNESLGFLEDYNEETKNVRIKSFGYADFNTDNNGLDRYEGFYTPKYRLKMSDGKWYSLDDGIFSYNVSSYSENCQGENTNCILDMDIEIPKNLDLIEISDYDTINYKTITDAYHCMPGTVLNNETKNCNGAGQFENWRQAGNSEDGEWSVSEMGNSVTQSINGRPTFFISDIEYQDNVSFEGLITVKTDWDDDYVGLVFGFQDANNYYAVFSTRDINDPTVGTANGTHTNDTLWLIRYIDGVKHYLKHTADYRGWRAFETNTVSVDYIDNNIKVYINGTQYIDYTDGSVESFQSGNIGFYNSSQGFVNYKGFSIQSSPTCNSGYVWYEEDKICILDMSKHQYNDSFEVNENQYSRAGTGDLGSIILDTLNYSKPICIASDRVTYCEEFSEYVNGKCVADAFCDEGYILTALGTCELNYTYNKYFCSDGFDIVQEGFDCFGTCLTNNCECNSATPPTNNCSKDALSDSDNITKQVRKIRTHPVSGALDASEYGKNKNYACGGTCDFNVNSITGDGDEICFEKINGTSSCLKVEGCTFVGNIYNSGNEIHELNIVDNHTITVDKYNEPFQVQNSDTLTCIAGTTYNRSTKQCEGRGEFNNWNQEGAATAGDWEVRDGGLTIYQKINGQPTYYVSDIVYQDNVTFEGRIKVDTDSDDDYVGFVFGFENTSNYFLMYSSRDINDPTVGTGNGTHKGDTIFLKRYVNGVATTLVSHANYRGWRAFENNLVVIKYIDNTIVITINGDEQINYIDENIEKFPSGRIGFYNLSQGKVQYSGFKIESSPTCASGFEWREVERSCIKDVIDNGNPFPYGAITSTCKMNGHVGWINREEGIVSVVPDGDKMIFWDSYADGKLGEIEFIKDTNDIDKEQGFIPEIEELYNITNDSFTSMRILDGSQVWSNPTAISDNKCDFYAHKHGLRRYISDYYDIASCPVGSDYSEYDKSCIKFVGHCDSGQHDESGRCLDFINNTMYGDILLIQNIGAPNGSQVLTSVNKSVNGSLSRDDLISRGYGNADRISLEVAGFGSGCGGVYFNPAPTGYRVLQDIGNISVANHYCGQNYLMGLGDAVYGKMYAYWDNPPATIAFGVDDFVAISQVDREEKFERIEEVCEAGYVFNTEVGLCKKNNSIDNFDEEILREMTGDQYYLNTINPTCLTGVFSLKRNKCLVGINEPILCVDGKFIENNTLSDLTNYGIWGNYDYFDSMSPIHVESGTYTFFIDTDGEAIMYVDGIEKVRTNSYTGFNLKLSSGYHEIKVKATGSVVGYKIERNRELIFSSRNICNNEAPPVCPETGFDLFNNNCYELETPFCSKGTMNEFGRCVVQPKCILIGDNNTDTYSVQIESFKIEYSQDGDSEFVCSGLSCENGCQEASCPTSFIGTKVELNEDDNQKYQSGTLCLDQECDANKGYFGLCGKDGVCPIKEDKIIEIDGDCKEKFCNGDGIYDMKSGKCKVLKCKDGYYPNPEGICIKR